MLIRIHKKHGWQRFFEPDYIAESVEDIDFTYLANRGVRTILIDLDSTVVSRGTFVVSETLTERLRDQPLDVYIATNRPSRRDLQGLQTKLNAKGVLNPVGLYAKPLPRYYAQATTRFGVKAGSTVMVGDRYFQDILGGNVAGFQTIVVKKLGRPANIFDRIISSLEQRRSDRLKSRYRPVIN
jgi:uncharacterized protein